MKKLSNFCLNHLAQNAKFNTGRLLVRTVGSIDGFFKNSHTNNKLNLEGFWNVSSDRYT